MMQIFIAYPLLISTKQAYFHTGHGVVNRLLLNGVGAVLAGAGKILRL